MVLFYIEECAGRPQPASLLPGAASISRRGSLWGSPPHNSPHNFLGSLWGGDSLADRRTLPSPFPLAKLLERTLERPGKELDPVSSNLVCLPSLLPEPTKGSCEGKKWSSPPDLNLVHLLQMLLLPTTLYSPAECWNLTLMRQHDFLPNSLSHHNTKVLVCRLDPREVTQLQPAVNVGAVACTWLSHSISISAECVFPHSAKMLKSKAPPLLLVLGLHLFSQHGENNLCIIYCL